MFDRDKWQEIFSIVRRNKLRSILTALGVFWGMFMLVGMVGFGNGLKGSVEKYTGGTAHNSVFMWARRTAMPYQ